MAPSDTPKELFFRLRFAGGARVIEFARASGGRGEPRAGGRPALRTTGKAEGREREREFEAN